MKLVMKCSSCRNVVIFAEGSNIALCEHCGVPNERPKSRDSELALLKYANERLSLGEFEKADEAYRKVLQRNLDEHEARWGLLLCKYGVQYVEDVRENCFVPTCRKSLNTSFLAETDFRLACEAAHPAVRMKYERDGRYIDDIQKEIAYLKSTGERTDVFICYKETEDVQPDGGMFPSMRPQKVRTADSVLAEQLYQALKKRGFNVFFAPVSLKDRLGANYEAAIYHAVDTAKIMLVLGTKPGYFESTWVKSEWKRILDRIDRGEDKRIIPIFRDFSADELPKAFRQRHLQALDMAQPDWMDTLVSCLRKVFPEPVPPEPTPFAKLLIRGRKELKAGDFAAARGCFNDALNADPESPRACLGMAMAELQARDEDALAQICAKGDGWLEMKYILWAEQYADDEVRAVLNRLYEARGAEIRKVFDFKMGEDGVSILRCKRNETRIVVPNTILRVPVIKIAIHAFENCDRTEEIVLPNSLRIIGFEAFKNCRKLRKLCHPLEMEAGAAGAATAAGAAGAAGVALWSELLVLAGLTGIALKMYQQHKKRTTTLLPRSLTKLGECALVGCTSMRTVFACRSTVVKNQGNPNIKIEYYD